ncbi:MAG: AAA domain-containing protein, partial [Candidatus Omnitrophota bacterium]
MPEITQVLENEVEESAQVDSIAQCFLDYLNQDYPQLLRRCPQAINNVDEISEEIIVTLLFLHAYYASGDLEGMGRLMVGLVDRSNDPAAIHSILLTFCFQFIFLPESLQALAGRAVIEQITSGRGTDWQRKYLLEFMVATRNQTFYQYLIDALAQAVGEGSQVNNSLGFSFQDIVIYLEYFCSLELLGFLENDLEIENIPSESKREALAELKNKVAEEMAPEPAIMLSNLQACFESGEYEQLDQMQAAYFRDNEIYLSGLASFDSEADAAISEINSVVSQAKEILTQQRRALSFYTKHNFSEAATQLQAAININPQDPDMVAFYESLQKLSAADTLYRQGNILGADDLALEARQAIEPGSFPVEPADEFIDKLNSYKRADAKKQSDPDSARDTLNALLKKYHKDLPARALLKVVEDNLKKRKGFFAAVDKALKAGDFAAAGDNLVSAFEFGSERKQVCAQVARDLKALIERGQCRLAVEAADRLIAVRRVDSIVKLRKKAWAGHQMSELEPHRHILTALLAARENCKTRIQEKYGQLRYLYSRCTIPEDSEEIFTVFGLQLRIPTGSGGVKNNDIPARDVARAGDSFIFLGLDGRAVSDDYFEVVRVERNSITFKFEDSQQYNNAKVSLAKKGGYIQKADDIALLRQKNTLDGVMRNLAETKDTQPSTGNDMLDILFGLAEMSVNVDEAYSANLLQNLIEKGVETDESQLRAVTQGVNLENKVTLIQGPPGTGKTTTITEITNYVVAVLIGLVGRGKRVLVVSQANAAVNNVGERLQDAGLPFVRVGNREKHISKKLMGNWLQRGEIAKRLKKEYEQDGRGFVVLGTNNGFLNDRCLT